MNDASVPASKGPAAFDEIRYRWEDVIPWEPKWEALSTKAREAFIGTVKASATPGTKMKPLTNMNKISPGVVTELLEGGFIELATPDPAKPMVRVFTPDAVIPFSIRIRDLYRYRLLRPEGRSKLADYCKHSFDTLVLGRHMKVILGQADITRPWYANDNCFDWSVRKSRWPEMVLPYLDAPVANQVIDALWAAEKPMTYPELFEKLNKFDVVAVRQAVRRLRLCLAVFEDVNPETGDIVVGLLPDMHYDRAKREFATTDFELKPSEVPVQQIPTAGLWIDDLRALLVEVVNEPPRIKDDGAPYKKDDIRLGAILQERHPALAKHSQSDSIRVASLVDLAVELKFCKSKYNANSEQLILAKPGEEWLGGSLVETYATLFKHFQPKKAAKRRSFSDRNPEEDFFAADVRVICRKGGRRRAYHWDADAKDVVKLLPAVWKFFANLTLNVFYPLEAVQRKFSISKTCPLLGGKKFNEIDIFFEADRIDDEEEIYERAADFFVQHLFERLLTLGCVKVGVDDVGKLHIARTVLLDAYYGKHTLTEQDLPDMNAGVKVVVQPDYSIVVIGMNPAPVAQLATFCERVHGSLAEGSVTLRITRDSVVKAIQRGMEPKAILNCLNQLSSNALPKNVEHEVNEWASWIRTVDVALLLVIQCPDRDTSDRVFSALREKAERLGERTIALDVDSLSTKQIAELKKNGVIVKEREFDNDLDDDDDDDDDDEYFDDEFDDD